MSEKRKKREQPNGATRPVGYCNPPIEHRFPPGVSGNPNGRPKKKKIVPLRYESDVTDLLLEEAGRRITIHENGKRLSLPAIQLVFRGLMVDAVKGKPNMRELAVRLTNHAAREREAEKIRQFNSALSQKIEWGDAFERAEAAGQAPPPILPHPMDIELDAENLAVKIVGPMTGEQHAQYDETREVRNDIVKELARRRALTDAGEEVALEQGDLSTEDLERVLAMAEAELPPSMRLRHGRIPLLPRSFKY
jgi:hypothetical protein